MSNEYRITQGISSDKTYHVAMPMAGSDMAYYNLIRVDAEGGLYVRTTVWDADSLSWVSEQSLMAEVLQTLVDIRTILNGGTYTPPSTDHVTSEDGYTITDESGNEIIPE